MLWRLCFLAVKYSGNGGIDNNTGMLLFHVLLDGVIERTSVSHYTFMLFITLL